MTQSPIKNTFKPRHIGPTEAEQHEMCAEIGVNSISTLLEETIPSAIRLQQPLSVSSAISEPEFLEKIRNSASKNRVFKSFIGQGYYNCYTPTVILRNIMENPGWYTQYTPYQAEIAQGRLEALLNFQTVVTELTGMDIANASLLDEGTAAAEAMTLLHRVRNKEKENAATFLISDTCFKQTVDVVKTRATPLSITTKTAPITTQDLTDDVFGILIQYPSYTGTVEDLAQLIRTAHEKNIKVAIATDLLALTLITPPGQWGADVVVGSAQRFGVPMGYGGPHAAFFASKADYSRFIPGRLIGVTIDRHNNKAYRMALQTREQHIRKEKATSNICTAQALLANMAGFYAVYHGPNGLREIGETTHKHSVALAEGFLVLGLTIPTKQWFDTFQVKTNLETQAKIRTACEKNSINLFYETTGTILVSCDETTTEKDVAAVLNAVATALGKDAPKPAFKNISTIPASLQRKVDYLSQPAFNSYHSETKLLRYMKSLENKDLSLNTSMIPLGSCTMKLNATTEMIPVTWPEFAHLHPFCPVEQAQGYQEIINELKKDLATITGFSHVSLQPNSGAQGEYAGLLTIRNYLESKGQGHRNVALIPTSAHGTNPASAALAGFHIVPIACDTLGNIRMDDLQDKCSQYKDQAAVLMVTYPSTHGVFEESITDICTLVHSIGAQVYMDGANMNAQVGLTNPKTIGADICHINLHKTFSIPHGGGGPGMGPIAAAEHLAPYLPGHSIIDLGTQYGAVSAAPWGSASILLISYAYIKLLGSDGITDATKVAILNANYMKARLEKYYPVAFVGTKGRVAHELILDMREFKKTAKIEVEDIAKRLMDYGFHAPTMSWPVPGTIMIEPTESEDKDELDRFCDALISIRAEIDAIASGEADAEDNVLRNAPHTAEEALSDTWAHPYTREKAVYPTKESRKNKFWPSVGRINQAYGDRNLVCTCDSVSDYAAV